MNPQRAILLQNQHPDVSVFVKNLNEITEGKTLREIFGEFGTIVSCKLAYDERGKSKGFAFVQYESEKAAQAAIEKVNGMLLDGKIIYVGKFIPRNGRNKERDERNVFTNLYVKNFGNDFTEDQLRLLFVPFGKIKSHKIMTDFEGRSKGFGFVAFEKADFAEAALHRLNGKQLSNGHKLYVARAQKKAERQQELQRQFQEQEEKRRLDNSNGLNLYVKNLDDSITDIQLRREFSLYGPLTTAKVMTDSSGRSKGYGFVHFVSPVDACFAAAGLNGSRLGSKPLYVSLAQHKEERRALLVAQHMRQRLQASESLFKASKVAYGRPSTKPSPQIRDRPPTASPRSSSSPVDTQRNNESSTRNVMRSAFLARKIQMQLTEPVKSQSCLSQKISTISPVSSSLKSPPPSERPSSSELPKNADSIPSIGKLSPKKLNSFMSLRSLPQTKTLTARLPPTKIAAENSSDLSKEKQTLGERLYYAVEKIYPHFAAKITGMILEMDIAELWHLLGNSEALRRKVEEAHQVYKAYLNDMCMDNN